VAIIDDADIQVQLPVDKLQVEEIPDDLIKVKEDTERIIRGYLAGVYTPATLASWTTPALTPDLIRAIGGRLAAALIYRTRYSEDSLDDPQFAQFKYNEAMRMLQGVIDGTLVLEDVPADSATQFSNEFFYPTNEADDPKFTMDAVF